MSEAYYNEHDPKAAAWLRELIKEGHIAPGIVDERSITAVKPHEIETYSQCHFFAGIGGWSLALRLAEWRDGRPVWTASLPCQPFSAAGEQKGGGDDRNLWPAFFALVRECRPQRIFGEQVAQAIGFNWLDGVSADLETEGYAVGSIVLGAHSVGAPHRRQRLYWMADSGLSGSDEWTRGRKQSLHYKDRGTVNGRARGLGDTESGGRGERGDAPLAGSSGHVERAGGSGLEFGRMGEPNGAGRDAGRQAAEAAGHGHSIEPASSWGNFDIIPCRDGKARRIESGTFPLANGIPHRVGLLRGYGNAIVPALAATFIQACEEALANTLPPPQPSPER